MILLVCSCFRRDSGSESDLVDHQGPGRQNPRSFVQSTTTSPLRLAFLFSYTNTTSPPQVHDHKSFVARLFIHLDHHHHCSIEVVHFAVHHHKSMTPLWSIISIIHYPLYPVHYDLLLMALVGPIPQLFPFLSPHKHSNDL